MTRGRHFDSFDVTPSDCELKMYQKLFGDRSPPRPAKGEGLAAFPDHQLDLRVRPRAGRDKGKKREKGRERKLRQQ